MPNSIIFRRSTFLFPALVAALILFFGGPGAYSGIESPSVPFAGYSDTGPVQTAKTISDYGADGYKYKIVRSKENDFGGTEFDDSAWSGAKAAFSNNSQCRPAIVPIQTDWPGDSRLLTRKRVSIPEGASNVTLYFAVDNNIEKVFFNGVHVPFEFGNSGCPKVDESSISIPQELVRVGENLIAVQAYDYDFYTFFDMKVTAVEAMEEEAEFPFGIIDGRPSLVTKTISEWLIPDEASQSENMSEFCHSGGPITEARFEFTNENWKVTGDAKDYKNFAGYIQASDRGRGRLWYFSAPANFLGDISAAYGGNITFELNQFAEGSPTFQWELVRLSDGETELVYDPEENPKANGWTRLTVCLMPMPGWKAIVKGERTRAALLDDFIRVLTNLKELRINPEHTTDRETVGLRSVFLNKRLRKLTMIETEYFEKAKVTQRENNHD